MSDVFAGCRIGAVPYLNARPLIHGLGREISLEVPSRLAERFAAGELDVALLPVFEAVAGARATIVEGAAIASRGEVFSVFLAHRAPLAELETITLDPASRTSNHLLQCLLAEFHGLEPEYVAEPVEARLLIGDAALKFRRERAGTDWQFLDLGAEWLRVTGLPFVFACWVLRAEVADAGALAGALREAKRRGLVARGRIAAEFEDAAFVERYLTENIRFDLGAEEKQAIALFAALLRKHGLVAETRDVEIRYV